MIIEFKTLFIGFSPTCLVEESIITKVTRVIVTRERLELITIDKLRNELIEHCRLNIAYERKKVKNSNLNAWIRYKELFSNLS